MHLLTARGEPYDSDLGFKVDVIEWRIGHLDVLSTEDVVFDKKPLRPPDLYSQICVGHVAKHGNELTK